MSPKLRAATYTAVIPERIKQIALKRNVKMKDLASAVGTVYENFSRQIRKGTIRKDWLETICDELNVSRDYLTGNKERAALRSSDFNSITKQREALKQLMIFSCCGGLCEMIDRLSDNDISAITTDIMGMILEWDEILEKRMLQLDPTSGLYI